MLATAPHQLNRRGLCAAFTLVEVLLGVFIAVGLLLVVLYFYSKAAELRAQLIEETERLTALRQVMERLTAELRCAHAPATAHRPFVGQPTALEFVTASCPRLTAWSWGSAGRSGPPDVGLKLVSYSLGSGLEGTNTVVTGLIRTERSVVATQASSVESGPAKPPQPEAPAESEEDLGMRALDGSASGSNVVAVAPVRASLRRMTSSRAAPVIEAIRFVRFRYRAAAAGAAETKLRPKDRSGLTGASLEDWQETWTGPGLPQAVEVSLGLEPLPPDTLPEDYPYELFRRVIYLPSHAASRLWAQEAEPAASEANAEPTP